MSVLRVTLDSLQKQNLCSTKRLIYCKNKDSACATIVENTLSECFSSKTIFEPIPVINHTCVILVEKLLVKRPPWRLICESILVWSPSSVNFVMRPLMYQVPWPPMKCGSTIVGNDHSFARFAPKVFPRNQLLGNMKQFINLKRNTIAPTVQKSLPEQII